MRPDDREIRLLLTGGGTGGHLFPAVAAAEKFQKLYPGTSVLFVGTKRKIDRKTLDSYGFASQSILSYGLKGKSPAELLKAFLVLPLSLFQAVRIITSFRPQVILGVGGYVTGPVVAAGRLLGIPTVIHEQNSVPGLANRKLGQIADRICLSLPGSEIFFPAEKTSLTGNPVRQDILLLAEKSERKHGEGRTLLVLGGSQGAAAVNRLASEAVCSLGEEVRKELRVIHQTGAKDEQRIRSAYERAGVKAEVSAFFTAMHEVYSRADLVISRAGATSLAEMAVLGMPVVLIPYPHAADNHQEKNGDFYVSGGGALLFREKELTPEVLAQTVLALFSDRTRLESMSRAMKQLSYPEAAERIVRCCYREIRSSRRK
jgi:UDP-N-acetylglucosamine--N-acetylmuramyl-(pentapeptide) pyrophosphoryl-undecaprenol N-acetylglucosamine transferase